jgi:excisionase family DNA binding protein
VLLGKSEEHCVPGATLKITPQTPFDELPSQLTVEEYAAYERFSRSTAYAHVRSGLIPHRRYGRLIRIPKAVISVEATTT